MSSENVVVVDLFCGAGGFSSGAALACEELGHENVELHAVNHWDVAIESHERNHPWAEHYHAGIEELNPPEVADPGSVDLLVAGPECTHFSTARGGKPVKEQKRAPAFHVLDWVHKLAPENVLLENVKEFRSWGSIDDDGQPTRDGDVFEQWLGVLESFGYATDHRVLNAADYGDPTSRNRLFVVASRVQAPTYPEPTHAEDPGDVDGREPWRTAAEVIDWNDLGGSLWTRDLENPRVQPLSQNTMARIAEGIRRHCGDRLEPLADALEEIGPDRLEALRETVVPIEYAEIVADAVDEPFLVRCPGTASAGLATPYLLGQQSSNQPRSAVGRAVPTVTTVPRIASCNPEAFVLGQHSNSVARDVGERPAPTVATGGKIQLCNPEAFVLRQQSGGVPAAVGGDPLPTISTGGAIALANPIGRPLVMPRNGAHRGLHSNRLYRPEDRPLHTVTARNTDGYLVTPQLIHYSHGGSTRAVTEHPMPTIATERGGAFALSSPIVEPFLVEYYGNSGSQPVDEPLPTVTTKDRFALVVPETFPWGLDVKYRMLKPSELKQAQGFPEDYELAGDTKRDVTEQIGNAVPVNLASALCKHLLGEGDPNLSSYGGGIQADPDADVPEYEELISGDD